MSRYETSTERLKFGGMKAVYWHRIYDKPGGRVIDAWISCSTKYLGTDFEDLMNAISERVEEVRK